MYWRTHSPHMLKQYVTHKMKRIGKASEDGEDIQKPSMNRKI